MTSGIIKELLLQSKVVNDPGNNKEFILLSLQTNVFNWVKEMRFKGPLIPLSIQKRVVKRGVC